MTITKNISATTITKQDPLPIDEIARFPLPGMSIPDSLAFRPDNKEISYLASPDGGLTTSLYAFDLQTGSHTLLADPPGGGTTETNISREEALRRERQRDRADWVSPSIYGLPIPIGCLFPFEVIFTPSKNLGAPCSCCWMQVVNRRLTLNFHQMECGFHMYRITNCLSSHLQVEHRA